MEQILQSETSVCLFTLCLNCILWKESCVGSSCMGVCKGGVGGGVDVELNFSPFSTCLNKAITSERRSICNVFSHWLKPCTVLFQTMKTSHDFILISVGPDGPVLLLWLQDCIEFDYRPKMNSHVLKSYVSKFAVKLIKLNWVMFDKGRCDWHAEYTTAWCQMVL